MSAQRLDCALCNWFINAEGWSAEQTRAAIDAHNVAEHANIAAFRIAAETVLRIEVRGIVVVATFPAGTKLTKGEAEMVGKILGSAS